jgi:hypothetical protein
MRRIFSKCLSRVANVLLNFQQVYAQMLFTTCKWFCSTFRKLVEKVEGFIFSMNNIMARYNKTADGKYHIKGKTYESLVGTRAQVWHGTAYKTSGGLLKTDLMQNKSGRIVSEKKHITASKEQRLIKHGYGTKKGKFGFVKIGSKTRRSKKTK